jgi:hypothetical protein
MEIQEGVPKVYHPSANLAVAEQRRNAMVIDGNDLLKRTRKRRSTA